MRTWWMEWNLPKVNLKQTQLVLQTGNGIWKDQMEWDFFSSLYESVGYMNPNSLS